MRHGYQLQDIDSGQVPKLWWTDLALQVQEKDGGSHGGSWGRCGREGACVVVEAMGKAGRGTRVMGTARWPEKEQAEAYTMWMGDSASRRGMEWSSSKLGTVVNGDGHLG